MSLTGGIAVDPSLVSAFTEANATNRNVFAISVRVSKDAIALADTRTSIDTSFENNYDSLVAPLLPDSEPRFVLVRLEQSTATGESAWLVVQYVPDVAHVREKMLYASCKSALVRDLGGDMRFVDHLHATNKNECSLEGYRSHLAHKLAPPPMNEKEVELAQLKLTETGAEVGLSTRREVASGVGFAWSADAEDAVRALGGSSDTDPRRVNLVALSIDAETLVLAAQSATASPDALQSLLPDGEPLFVFYKHNSLDTANDKVLFYYICPPSSKVKARMLFSSSRQPTLEHVEKNLGVVLAKKIEIDSASEISLASVTEELSPAKPDILAGVTKAAFKKPSRPGKK